MKLDPDLLLALLEEIEKTDTVKGTDQKTIYHMYLLKDGGLITGIIIDEYPQSGELGWRHDPAPRLTWRGQEYLAESRKAKQ